MLRISNCDARRLWIDAQGLSRVPTGPLDLLEIIKNIGFVQLDTLRVVTRAHHHILWSRNQNYREPMLWEALAKDRSLFEHFTHDASLLPMEYYPYWQRQFSRKEKNAQKYNWNMGPDLHTKIKQKIKEEGPLSTHAFDTKRKGKAGMWNHPPHKKALDYMWYAGELSTSHRVNFTKFYDLTERVIPHDVRKATISDSAQIDWLCAGALRRLAIANRGEMSRFWDALSAKEVKTWCEANADQWTEIEMQGADGKWTKSIAPHDIGQRLAAAPVPTSRLRILSPFDPLIRDRKRLERLFGFNYRIEIFVPAAQRKWGYYVYPLLEGDRFVGRLEVRADRKENILNVMRLWAEPTITWSTARAQKLDAELARLAKFVGVQEVVWTKKTV
jgi:uncharacterized protein YcaQ